jgi:hypothetical protein
LNRYNEALNICQEPCSKHGKKAAIGRAKALLKLSKYKQMHDFLIKRGDFHGLKEMFEYYLYLSKAYCKINNNYTEANGILEKANKCLENS